MNSARGMGGVIGAILWIMINDVAGGIAGLAAGRLAMSSFEPVLGELAGCLLLAAVPLGLVAGGLFGAATLGWAAGLNLSETRPALTNG